MAVNMSATYYIVGDGTDDPNGKWCNGTNWEFQAMDENNSITFYGVAGGKNYGFKITNAADWDHNQYTTFDYDGSDKPLYGGNGSDMGFTLTEDADVTISFVDGKVRVKATKALAYRSNYYYIAGNASVMGSWSPNAVALTNDQITFSNLPAEWYDFKITNGSWDKQWTYSELDVAKSSPMHKTYGDGGNICFRLQAAADVTIKMEDGKVVLLIDRDYCITGNKEWIGGDGWASSTAYTLNQGNNYTYTFYNIVAGDYRFKVKENIDNAWNDDCTWGYAHLDTDHSNAGEDWDDGHNIGFHLAASADVTISLVDNKIRLNTQPVYYITCDVNSWATHDANYRLAVTENGYEKTLSLSAGEHKLRVINGDWPANGGTVWNYSNLDVSASSFGCYKDNDDDVNICFTLSAAADVTVQFDPATGKVVVTTPEGSFDGTPYSITGETALTGADWSSNGESMTDLGNGSFQYVVTDKYLAANTYEYKVLANHLWYDGCVYPVGFGNNAQVTIPEDGVYTLTYTFAPATKTLNCVAVRQTADVTISQYQFNTFYSDKAYTMPEGLTALIFTGIENEMLVMEEINPVPANTGVVLYGAANQTYALMQTQTDVTYNDNMLKGTLTDETINNANVHYILSLSDQDECGFFWPYNTNQGVGSFTNHAGKAYLEIPGGSSAPARIRGFILTAPRVATAIEDVNEDESENACYDLLGRKVSQPQQGGVYIMNGKKMIIF